jgi:hypothetical protein
MHRESETLRLLESNLSAILDFNAGKTSDEVSADRALQELSGLIRKLDDAEAVATVLRRLGLGEVGSVIQGNGKSEPLYLRDMTNKVAHGSKFTWSAEAQNVQCVSREPKRWQSATIDLDRLKVVVQAITGS